MGQLDRNILRKVRQKMAEAGTELTPDELEEVRESAFAKIRAGMAMFGYDTPTDDEALLEELKRAWLLNYLTSGRG